MRKRQARPGRGGYCPRPARASPQNLSEFFPWFLAILVVVALFLFVFGIIKDFTHTFARGGRF